MAMTNKAVWCPSCYQLYSNVTNQPQVLDCGHGSCTSCAEQMVAQARACPVCHVQVTAPTPDYDLIEQLHQAANNMKAMLTLEPQEQGDVEERKPQSLKERLGQWKAKGNNSEEKAGQRESSNSPSRVDVEERKPESLAERLNRWKAKGNNSEEKAEQRESSNGPSRVDVEERKPQSLKERLEQWKAKGNTQDQDS